MDAGPCVHNLPATAPPTSIFAGDCVHRTLDHWENPCPAWPDMDMTQQDPPSPRAHAQPELIDSKKCTHTHTYPRIGSRENLQDTLTLSSFPSMFSVLFFPNCSRSRHWFQLWPAPVLTHIVAAEKLPMTYIYIFIYHVCVFLPATSTSNVRPCGSTMLGVLKMPPSPPKKTP